MVRRNPLTLEGERDKVSKNRGRDRWREDGGRGERGADVLHLLGKVGNSR